MLPPMPAIPPVPALPSPPSHSATDKPVVAVIGSGAIGQFYGAQFVQAGCPVRFVARRDRERLTTRGMVIHQVATDQVRSTLLAEQVVLDPNRFTVHADGVSAAAAGPVDLVLVTLKTTAIDAARPLIEPLLAPHTLVVVLCNGLGVEEKIAAWAGAERLTGMLCFVCVNREADGTIRHLAHGQVAVGHLLDAAEPRQRLADACAIAGIRCRVPEVLLEARWRKLAWNIPFNGLCTKYDVPTDVILARHRAELDTLLAETIAIGNADLRRGGKGQVEAAWAEEQVRRTVGMGAYLPSTLLDRRAGQGLELDAMFVEPLRRARSLGIAAPALAGLIRELTALSG